MASKKGGRARGGRGKEEPPDVKLSKFLSYVCRHGAEKLRLEVREGGFISVAGILRLPQGQHYTEDDVERVVVTCSKQRFALQREAGQLCIRANQGHTMEVSGLELSPVVSAAGLAIVVHGTYHRAWGQIRQQGLSRMKRTHIHFATGLPGDSGVISGMRSSCEILIYIDLQKALDDGFQFHQSANGVVLCTGDERGFLPPFYLKKVVEIRSGEQLW